MKIGQYEYAAGLSRRKLLQSAASLGGLAAVGGLGFAPGAALADAHGDGRAAILAIPGVGVGSPGDADWQKVGEMTLAATKASVAEGEFAGVELNFLGLNNQNQHNVLFRGFLKPWETYNTRFHKYTRRY